MLNIKVEIHKHTKKTILVKAQQEKAQQEKAQQKHLDTQLCNSTIKKRCPLIGQYLT